MNAANNASETVKAGSYKVEVNGNTYEITFGEDGVDARINGKPVSLDIRLEREPDLYSVLMDGKSIILSIEENNAPGSFRVHTGGYDFETEVVSAREAYLREFIHGVDAGQKESRVKAPMPGMIVKSILAEGDTVERGQGVMIMEAMKMENEIKAPADGTLTRFHVQAGDAVEKGQVLFEIGLSESN